MTTHTAAHIIASESPCFANYTEEDQEKAIEYVEDAFEMEEMDETELVELFR